jgi:dTDP-glucose pyrophosphorylase
MTDLTHVIVREGATLRQALEAMTRSGKQIALVTDGETRLLGLVTDGDVRKAILRGTSLEAKVNEAMNRHPVVGEPGMTDGEALALMRHRAIRHLPLLDGQGRVTDLLILEDLLRPRPALRNRAVIMAGGQGTRLRPLTESTPKPLLTVGDRPLLEILIERLRLSGIVSVLIAVHHKADMIRERLGDGSRLGVALEYVEEPEPLGTMGALPLMRERLDHPFFVVNADILTKCDFRAMWEFHRSQAPAAMTVGVSIHQVDIPYGEFTLHEGRVTRVEEKPRKEFPVNAGIYLLDPSVIGLIPDGRYLDATDLIRALLDSGKTVTAYLIREYWLDVGRHHDLEKANRDVAEGLLD